MLILNGHEIKKFRELNNLSQYKLAKMVKCTRNQLAYWEYVKPDVELPQSLHLQFLHCKKLEKYIPVHKPCKVFQVWVKIMKIFGKK